MDQIVSDLIVDSSFDNLRPNVNKFTRCLLAVVFRSFGALVSGSTAELSIEPLLPCIGDCDLMLNVKDCLAVQSGHETPQRLRLTFIYEDTLKVYEIADCPFPGYVCLVKIGEYHKHFDNSHVFIYNTTAGADFPMKFTRDFNEERVKAREGLPSPWQEFNGPATVVARKKPLIDGRSLPIEIVYYIRCLSWPKQADDWPTRRREHNWPNPATTELIVDKLRCDLVPTVHHRCKHNELGRNLCRLSFSRAEIVLLNSWTLIQQTVYHMLRTVLSAEGLTAVRDTSGCRTLSRYHVKTLMLWICELKCPTWWNSFNAIVLSTKILRALMKCCVHGFCAGYFITKCNLFECDVKSAELNEVSQRLSLLTEVNRLTEWFVINYIRKYAEQIGLNDTQNVSSDVSILINMMSAIVNFNQRIAINERLDRYQRAQQIITNYDMSVASRFDPKVFQYFRTIDESLFHYVRAWICLRLCANLNDKNFTHFVDFVELFLRKENFRISTSNSVPKQCGSIFEVAVVCLQQSTLTLTHTNTTTSSFVQIVLPYTYLVRAIRLSKIISVQFLSRIYMAVLHYIGRQYHEALEQCTWSDQLNYRFGVVEGQLLPKFDEIGDNVLGIVVLYQYVQTEAKAALHLKQTKNPLCNVFTPKHFLNFIRFRCMQHNVFRERQHRENRRHLKLRFVSDYLLCYLSSSISHQPMNCFRDFAMNQQSSNVSSADFAVSGLRQMLVVFAVEQLTQYHEFISREFSAVCTVSTTDIQALYYFRSGLYERCLELSQQNVLNLWPLTDRHHFVVLSLAMVPLLDDTLAAVTGLVHIFDQITLNVNVYQLTLFAYLTAMCKLKLRRPDKELIDEMYDLRLHTKYYTASNRFDRNRLLLSFAYRCLLIRIRARLL